METKAPLRSRSFYITVQLPGELGNRIDEYLQDNPWGHRSRAEVVADAVRRFLKEEEDRLIRRHELEKER